MSAKEIAKAGQILYVKPHKGHYIVICHTMNKTAIACYISKRLQK